MKKLLLTFALIATTTVTLAQDALSWSPQDATYIASSSISVSFKYTSDLPIPAQGIKIELWTVTGGVWSQAWRQWTANWSELPAGTDQPATLVLDNFVAAINSGSAIMTDTQLTAANPNGTAGATSSYYELRVVLGGGDGSFAPTNPGTSYIHISPSLSTNELTLKSIHIFPNPVKEILNITNHKEYKSLSIYNLLGKELKSFTSQEAINVSELSSGIYLIKSENGNTSKFIKD